MAWTTIPDANLEPGKPARSVDAIALRDNPIAIAHGMAGAPRIITAALAPPEVGDAVILRFFASNAYEATTSSLTYVDAGAGATVLDQSRHLWFRVIKDGVIRCSLEHRSPSGDTMSSCRILHNAAVAGQWSTSSSSWLSRTVDLGVSIGDIVAFQQIGAGTDPITGGVSAWRNLRVSSNDKNIAVV